MTAAHTPGPWKAHDSVGVDFVRTADDASNAIASVDGVWCGKKARRANARLIAAAPEMYEACKEALDLLAYDDLDESETRVLDLIRYALARAEGGGG